MPLRPLSLTQSNCLSMPFIFNVVIGRSWPLPAGKKAKQQTDPPSIPVSQLFTSGDFPEGEWQSYKEE